MSRKQTRRRRVSALDDDEQDAGAIESSVALVRARSASTVLARKKRGGLSFTQDDDGDGVDGGGGDGAGDNGADTTTTFSALRNASLAARVKPPPEPLLLDLKGLKPAYDASELEKLKRETRLLGVAGGSSIASPEPAAVILAGDEVLATEDGSSEENGGGKQAIPTVEQIRVAKERRERMRARGPDEDDFIPLVGGSGGGGGGDGTAAVERQRASSEEPDEDESRFVRDKESDSDEPFEEHRASKIRFGAPGESAPDAQERRHAAASDVASAQAGEDARAASEWELEQIRKGAYDRGAELSDVRDVVDAQKRAKRESNAARLVNAATTFKPRSLNDVQQGSAKRVRELSERQRLLKSQHLAAQAMVNDARLELPALRAALDEAAAKFDFLQRVRDYTHNVIDCVSSCMPQIEACEAQLASLYAQRGADARAQSQAAELGWAGPGMVRVLVDLERRLQLEADAAAILEGVVDDYASSRVMASKFEAFRTAYPALFSGAYIGDSLVDVFVPYARWELLSWDGFIDEDAPALSELGWFQVAVALFGEHSEESFLAVLSKALVPKVTALLMLAYDSSARAETARAIVQVEELLSLFQSSPQTLQPLLDDAIVTPLIAAMRVGDVASVWFALRVAHGALRWAASLPAPQGPRLAAAASIFVEHVAAPLARRDATLAAQIAADSEATAFLAQYMSAQ